jgi:type II secretory ATPase GspE/PulE/Tfp pilus assembly ATPase PilB-like protein
MLLKPLRNAPNDPDLPLTAEGGPFDRGDNFRAIVAFYADGRFLVSRSHVNNPQIISFIEEIKLDGFENIEVQPVDIGIISGLYDKSRGGMRASGGRDSARMRREVIELVGSLSKRRASDIHIIVGETSCSVRGRIDGSMQHVADWPADYGHSFCAAAFAMADASDVNYQPYEYQGARCSNRKDLRLPDGVISLRMQFNPTTYGGRALIIRILYDSDDRTKGDIGDLGFAPEQVEDFEMLRAKPFGINIVAGPTGHGKSTTLQRNILAILREYKNNIAIFTVEDPPEYPIPGAVQMPVVNASSSEERAEAFTKAIAAALRSNPDRIMIGEVRDSSSAKLAFEAAMTGHQVWTTLHSNDAITIPFRLKDLHVEEYKLVDPTLLTGLISQRLVRKLCSHCRRGVINSDDLPHGVLSRLEEVEIPLNSVRIHNPKGCEKCAYTGYSGRTIAAEIILPDVGFMDFVKVDNKAAAFDYWINELNGRTMVEYGMDLVRKGICSPTDAERVLGYLHRPKRSRSQ